MLLLFVNLNFFFFKEEEEEEEEEYEQEQFEEEDRQPQRSSYQFDEQEAHAEVDTGDLVPCQECGRKFNPDRLAKHQKACKKVNNSKRKTFNSAAARVEGTGAEKFQSKG